GGIKLPGFKSQSTQAPIQDIPVAPQLVFPLRQHIGEPSEPVVAVGENVYKGQLIARSTGYVSAPVHASSSGVVTAIEPRTVPHPSQSTEMCIVIDTDGKDQWLPGIEPELRPENLSVDTLRKRIRDAGVVGLGGAVFPAAAKLKPTREISTLVINGVECEPFITCDDMLMRSHPEQVIRGAFIVNRMVNAYEIVIAIEDNKPHAYNAMVTTVKKFRDAGVLTANSIEIVKVPTQFPAGGEKQLIKVLTGKSVPSKSLPYEVGVVCINVGTAAAIYQAIYNNKPLVSRIVTVSGHNVKNPGNYFVPIGTPMAFVIEQAGGAKQKPFRIIMGGPMMGFNISSTQTPVVKATNNLLIDYCEQTPVHSMPCIRCGACESSCPMHLMPQQLYWHARADAFKQLQRYHIDDCIECGCCAVVCPSHIPLVQYFRYGKTQLRSQERQHKKAEVSRIRNEQRLARIERQKQEKAARKSKRGLRKRKAPTSQGDTDTQSVKTESNVDNPSKQVSTG
ncbi:MAG: electron transport complex subunit RsxC, partial [Gammaproteobacteria bacterium]